MMKYINSIFIEEEDEDEEESPPDEKIRKETRNQVLLTKVPGSTIKRAVNVPAGYPKEEDQQSTYFPASDIKLSLYDPKTLTYRLTFANGTTETWTVEAVGDMAETLRTLSQQIEDEEASEKIRELRIRGISERLQAIHKLRAAHEKAHNREKREKEDLRAAYFRDYHSMREKDRKVRAQIIWDGDDEPETMEEIASLDGYSFKIWLKEASVEELEAFSSWQSSRKQVSFFQRFLNFFLVIV